MAPTNQPPPKKGTAPTKAGGSGAGGFFTKQVGPLPMWGWLAVAVVGFVIWRKLSGSSSSATTAATTGTGTPATETVTTAGGTYSGPSQGGIPESITNPTPTPGSTGSPTPGSGGNSTPRTPAHSSAPVYTLVSDPNVVQQDLNSGVPVYYEPPGGDTPANTPPERLTSNQGGGWLAGSNPLPTGAGGTVYTRSG